MAYDQKAQDFAFSFFTRGMSRDRAVREIRKVYPGFSNSTWDAWVESLGWRERRAQLDFKRAEFERIAEDAAQVLMLELNEMREKLKAELLANPADTQRGYFYASICKQIAALATDHLKGRADQRVATDVLMRAFERFITGLRDMPGLEPALEANAARIGKLTEDIAGEFGREG
jgi:hypothetical protein